MKTLSAVLGSIFIVIGVIAIFASIEEPMALGFAAAFVVSGVTLLIIAKVLEHLQNIEDANDKIQRYAKASAKASQLQSALLGVSIKEANAMEYAKLVKRLWEDFDEEELDWAKAHLKSQAPREEIT